MAATKYTCIYKIVEQSRISEDEQLEEILVMFDVFSIFTQNKDNGNCKLYMTD